MNTVIYAVMRHLNNFFVLPGQQFIGEICIEKGMLHIPLDLKVGQYVLLEKTGEHTGAQGSYRISAKKAHRGGGYAYRLDGLENVSDTWTGRMFGQNVPHDFVEICGEMHVYMTNPENLPSAKTGESVIGFYSWTRATGNDGKPLTVFEVFGDRLVPWRRYTTGVRY